MLRDLLTSAIGECAALVGRHADPGTERNTAEAAAKAGGPAQQPPADAQAIITNDHAVAVIAAQAIITNDHAVAVIAAQAIPVLGKTGPAR